MRKRIEKCSKCKGTGETGSFQKQCHICNGTGKNEEGTRCYNCIGWGFVGWVIIKCEACKGKGYRDWIDRIRRPI